jgi:hypothetical protein
MLEHRPQPVGCALERTITCINLFQIPSYSKLEHDVMEILEAWLSAFPIALAGGALKSAPYKFTRGVEPREEP